MKVIYYVKKALNNYTTKRFIVFSIWFIFGLLSLIYFVRAMVDTHSFYNTNDPYTMDSVWHTGATSVHNDVLLYTLFSGRTIYISPDSWYILYVKAFAENVVVDEKLIASVNSEEVDLSQYSCINHMLAVAHSTLFDEDVIELISNNAQEGAAYLYIDEENLASSKGIIVYHDEVGNLYLRGYECEEKQ